jgi:hypothetical protein
MSTFPSRPPRTVVQRPAFVVLDNGSRLPCLIRNVSRQGACISIINADLPVDNIVLEDKFTRERWQAEVRWRGNNCIGLRLTGTPPSTAPSKGPGFGRRQSAPRAGEQSDF